MTGKRIGWMPLGIQPGKLSWGTEIALRTDRLRLRKGESYRVTELVVPTNLLGNSILVTSLAVEAAIGETREESLITKDPVLLDAFHQFPIEGLRIFSGERASVRLMSTAIMDIAVYLSFRGEFQKVEGK